MMSRVNRFSKTLREEIVDILREAIIKNKLKPGTKISEMELAEEYGISRTPVREALWQLESEGFVKIIPRKGAVVATITEEDVRNFYELRALLESYAATRTLDKMTEKDIKKLESLNKKMEKAYKAGDVKELYRAHNEFHKQLIKHCENKLLLQILENLYQRFQRFRWYLTLLKKMEGSIEQHWQIIDAIKRRDREAVAELVKENAYYGIETLIREVLKRSGDFSPPEEK